MALIQPDRILFASDSRLTFVDSSEPPNDKYCKIVVFADGAFAINGSADVRHRDDDSIAWDGFALGKKVYTEHKGNIYDAATEWANSTADFWKPFFSHQIKDGEDLLRRNGPTWRIMTWLDSSANQIDPESSLVQLK